MKSAELQALYEQDPKKAFEELLLDAEYRQHLLRAAVRFLGTHATKELAEDCVQEALVSTYESSISSSEIGTPLRKRIFINLKNRCAIEVRNHRRVELALKEFHSEQTPQPDLSFFSEGEPEEIQAAINQLSDRKKTIVYLHYYANMSISSIAEYLGVTFQSCANRLNEAQTQLREYLGTRYADRFSRKETTALASEEVADDTTSHTELLQLFRATQT